VIVLDASAAVDLLTPIEPQATWVSRAIAAGEDDLHAPHLLDLEVASAVRRRALAGELSARVGAAILDDLADLRLTRYPHTLLLPRVWELRRTTTSYDAAYIALAEILGCPLVTTDTALARVRGHRARLVAFRATD
jgi:predicted nucleic acid-binding protein